MIAVNSDLIQICRSSNTQQGGSKIYNIHICWIFLPVQNYFALLYFWQWITDHKIKKNMNNCRKIQHYSTVTKTEKAQEFKDISQPANSHRLTKLTKTHTNSMLDWNPELKYHTAFSNIKNHFFLYYIF